MNPRLPALALGAALLLSACSAGPASLTSAADAPGGAFDHDHAALDGLLARHVLPDGVDYRGLAGESAELDRYLAALHAVGPDDLGAWDPDQRHAFWINVYNAHILRLIVDHVDEPPASIRDLGGAVVNRIWDQPLIPMADLHPTGAGRDLSFSEVEHEILRPRFEDARVHAAINCASTSCPPLLAEAYRAEVLDEQLDRAMAGFVADPTRNRLDAAAGRLELSAIFDWFAEDFVRDAGSVREYVARYAPLADADWILDAKVSYLDYDWSLNDASR